MADTIKLPGFGEQKKQTVFVIGGVVLGVLGIAYYRSRKAAASVASTPATDTTDTTGDTSTQDAALAGAYDSSAYGSGTADLTGTSLPSNTPQPGGYTSNAQWSQAAEDYLANSVGLSATDVQAALGKYLTGGSVTSAQQNIIEQAIAAEGYPPQAGPNGYPPSVQLQATSTPTSQALAPPSLSIVSKRKGAAVLAWTPVTGAAGYQVYYNGRPYRHPGAATVIHATAATVAYNGIYTVYPVPPTTSRQYVTDLATSKSNPVTVGGI